MTVRESRLKDGVLKLGDESTGSDFSCKVTNLRIKSNYNQNDGQETLCGDVIAGDTTLKGRSLAGTVIQDFDNQDGFVNYCFLHDLEVVAFTYTPNSVGAATYTGNVTVQVPDETVGGDVNTRLTSDIDWQMGGLDIAYPSAATGATAGTPGTWTPSGSSPPADVAALQAGGVTASPSAAWTTGEYVQTGASGSAGEAHWDGTAWTAGKAP